MSRQFSFAVDEFYHLYTRGVEKREVFLENDDYWRFLMLLYVCNSNRTIHLSNFRRKDSSIIFSTNRGETLVSIGAYCLMPNHFHLLVREKIDGGVSLFMQKLMTAYTMYFNKKYSRRGSLFESTFLAREVLDDNYLRYLFAYIHLNPVKIKDPGSWGGKKIKNLSLAKEFLRNYRFSSYQFYMDRVEVESDIIERAVFPEYFSDFKNFNQFVDEWIRFSSDDDEE